MPATAVGSANGKSTSASTNRRPGNWYRTSTQATTKPNTALTAAAISDAPTLSRYDATTRGSLMVCQNASHVIDAVRAGSVISGTMTMRQRYSSVNPIVILKPGRTERLVTIATGLVD